MATLTPEKQAVKPQDDDLSWLFDAPRGTVYLCPDESGAYVRGSETVYYVSRPELTCECKGYEHRKDCFHVRAVREELRRVAPCPVCRGAGVIEPVEVVHYVRNGKRDTEPLPRVCCQGAGTREAWIEGGRVGVVRTSGLTEEERRALFR